MKCLIYFNRRVFRNEGPDEHGDLICLITFSVFKQYILLYKGFLKTSSKRVSMNRGASNEYLQHTFYREI